MALTYNSAKVAWPPDAAHGCLVAAELTTFLGPRPGNPTRNEKMEPEFTLLPTLRYGTGGGFPYDRRPEARGDTGRGAEPVEPGHTARGISPRMSRPRREICSNPRWCDIIRRESPFPVDKHLSWMSPFTPFSPFYCILKIYFIHQFATLSFFHSRQI